MTNFSMLLSIQSTVGFISLFGALLVVFTVVFLIGTSKSNEDSHKAKEKVYRLRTKYFWGLIVLLACVLFTSFKFMPYADSKKDVNTVVNVLAYQWGWKISMEEEFPENLKEFKGKPMVEVPVNEPVKFRVTAQDVTHNFGVYNEEGNIVTQVQAVPGHSNDLVYTFTQPGTYKVLCLEYCGLAHAFMIATINVN